MTAGPTEPIETPQATGPEDPEQKKVETPAAERAADSVGVLMVAGISTICALIVVTLAIVGYMKFVDVGTRVGVVDIENVMETKQAQLALLVFGKSATEKEISEAYDDAHRFGDRIHEALKTAENECKCVLLTSAAIVQGNPVDMTGRVKELVGLLGVDLEAVKAELDKKMQFAPSIFGSANNSAPGGK